MTKEEIQRVLDLSLEYYKSEVFGTNKESEKPSRERIDWIYDKMKGDLEIPNDLEKAAVNIADKLLAKPKDYALSAKADYWNGAYDGIIAGAKWQKEQDLAEMAQSKSPLSVAYANRCFENGKQAMREQMMKEAVETRVIGIGLGDTPHIVLGLSDEFKKGDKVRVIVLPKED